MKKLIILLLAVFLALSVDMCFAQMNKGDLINKQTETLDNSRKTVRGQDIMTPSTKSQQGRVLTDSDSNEATRAKKGMEKPNPKEEVVASGVKKEPLMPSDEIMVILYPAPPVSWPMEPSPIYGFGDGIKGRIPPSKMNKADLIEATSAKKPPKGYRYVLGFTPKEDGPFVVYSDEEGTITAMLKKGDRKPKKYWSEGLAISDMGPQTTRGKLFVGGLSALPGGPTGGDDGGTTCWRCYEIDGKLHCFEVDCPFDITADTEESSVSPEVLRTVIPKDPGSTIPPGSTTPQDPGRTTGVTGTGDPGRSSSGQESSSSSSTIIRRGGD